MQQSGAWRQIARLAVHPSRHALRVPSPVHVHHVKSRVMAWNQQLRTLTGGLSTQRTADAIKIGVVVSILTGAGIASAWQLHKAWNEPDAHPYVSALRLLAALTQSGLGIDGVIVKALKAFCDSPESRILVIQNGGLSIALALLRAAESRPDLIGDVLDLIELLCSDNFDNCAVVFSRLSKAHWGIILSQCSPGLARVLASYVANLAPCDAAGFRAKFMSLCDSEGLAIVLHAAQRDGLDESMQLTTLRLATRALDYTSPAAFLQASPHADADATLLDQAITVAVQASQVSGITASGAAVQLLAWQLLEGVAGKLQLLPEGTGSRLEEVLSADAAVKLVRHLVQSAVLAPGLPPAQADVPWRAASSPSASGPLPPPANAPSRPIAASTALPMLSEADLKHAHHVARLALSSLSRLLQLPHLHAVVASSAAADGGPFKQILEAIKSYVYGNHHSFALDAAWSDVLCQFVKPATAATASTTYHLDVNTGITVGEETAITTSTDDSDGDSDERLSWWQYFEHTGERVMKPLKVVCALRVAIVSP